MKCYPERIIRGLLFTAGGLDQTTHPLHGFTFRTEAALCLQWARLHIHIHARRRLVKGMTHETLMSGVCVCVCGVRRQGFGKQYSRCVCEGAHHHPLPRPHDFVFILVFHFLLPGFQGRWFAFRRTMKSEVDSFNTV